MFGLILILMSCGSSATYFDCRSADFFTCSFICRISDMSTSLSSPNSLSVLCSIVSILPVFCASVSTARGDQKVMKLAL